MIVDCPKCSSQFILPDKELGEAGRRVQCSACYAIWTQKDDEILDVIEADSLIGHRGSESLGDNDSEIERVVDDLDEFSVSDNNVDDEKPEADGADAEVIDEDLDLEISEKDDDDFTADLLDSDDTENQDINSLDDLADVVQDVGSDGDVNIEDVNVDDASDDLSESDVPSNDDQSEIQIPEAVKPLKSNVQGVNADHYLTSKIASEGSFVSFVLVASFFLLSFISLILFRSSITEMWPSTHAAYNLIGLAPYVPGHGLIFDRVEIVEYDKGYKLSGGIINFEKRDVKVPMISVSVVSDEEEVLDSWYIEPPVDLMKAEETVRFESVLESNHPDVPYQDSARQVKVKFVLFLRTDGEDGDSNHVPRSVDRVPQNDDAALSKSSQSVSSQLHQGSAH